MDERLSMMPRGVEERARGGAWWEDGVGGTRVSADDGVGCYRVRGLALGLFGREALAEDARHPIDGRFSGVTIAINGRSREEVDAMFAQALAAGAKALKPPEPVFWGGYSGYFADPDGHVWEVAHNPGAIIGADGSTTFQADEA